MPAQIQSLKTYPIKGLSPVDHMSVSLTAGEGFPGDRVFGFAKGNSGFDASNPRPLPKDRFLVWMEHAALAGLATRIDPDTLLFDITDASGTRMSFDLATAEGQAEAAAYFADLLNLADAEIPFFAQAFPHRFTDVSVASQQMMHAISLINRTSVRELGARCGADLHPARFRANIEIDGWPPFAELDLVGTQIQLGALTFDVLKRTRRCPATQVNPVSAERDLNVPALIKEHFGHLDMGVYIQARQSGTLKIGDAAIISA